MQFPNQCITTLALSVLATTAAWADTAQQPSNEPATTVAVSLSYESATQHSAHTATATAGEPVTVVFAKNGQKIKIHYVVDYDSSGYGQIISEIQSAPANSEVWTPLRSYSARFEDGKDFSIQGNQTDGTLFAVKLRIAQNASL